jgi:hypothetical protein
VKTRQEVVSAALAVLDEIEPLIAATRRCLTSSQPGFPIYLFDVHRCGLSLMLLAAQHSTLLETERAKYVRRRRGRVT